MTGFIIEKGKKIEKNLTRLLFGVRQIGKVYVLLNITTF